MSFVESGSFTQKLITVEIQLASAPGTNQPISLTPGTIQGAGNSVTLSGLRTSVRVWNAGAAVGCHATIKVWGLTQSLMNQLATLGMAFNIIPKNIITVMAGDNTAPLATVFQGTIYAAYGDYEAMPDVPMTFIAVSGGGAVVTKANPTNFPGSASIATMMQSLATSMGFNFENNGVTGTLADEYLEGTLYDQAKKVAEDAGIEWGIINGTTLAIWQKGDSRSSLTIVPIIAAPPIGQMIGYPAYTQQGIIVKTLFNPQVQFGGRIQVVSSLPQASGIWSVYKIDQALDSLVRNGQWMSTCYAYNPNFNRGIIPPSTG